MSKITELASGAITAVDTVTIELGEADETRRSSSSHGLPRQPSFTRAISAWRSDKTGTHGSLTQSSAIGSPKFAQVRFPWSAQGCVSPRMSANARECTPVARHLATFPRSSASHHCRLEPHRSPIREAWVTPDGNVGRRHRQGVIITRLKLRQHADVLLGVAQRRRAAAYGASQAGSTDGHRRRTPRRRRLLTAC